MKRVLAHSTFADFLGEFIGTCILVLFGLGAGTTSILYSSHSGLFQIALIWGIGVTLAVYATRHISFAHLNPVVSIAMIIARRMPVKKLPIYMAGQFAGAFFAAVLLYAMFSDSIAAFEFNNHIVRGSRESIRTAMMFGEYYPNPTSGINAAVSMSTACITEIIGTFALVFLIFCLTEGCNVGRPDNSLAPVIIGLAVTVIISVIAPITQACLNPARDLSPRLFAYLAGWKDAAFPEDKWGVLVVYVMGPLLGAILAALSFTTIVERVMDNKRSEA